MGESDQMQPYCPSGPHGHHKQKSIKSTLYMPSSFSNAPLYSTSDNLLTKYMKRNWTSAMVNIFQKIGEFFSSPDDATDNL